MLLYFAMQKLSDSSLIFNLKSKTFKLGIESVDLTGLDFN